MPRNRLSCLTASIALATALMFSWLGTEGESREQAGRSLHGHRDDSPAREGRDDDKNWNSLSRSPIDAPSVSPSAIAAGQATAVVVRVQIRDRSVEPRSVVAKLVDERGRTTQALGPLRDDAQGADRVARDRSYAGAFTIASVGAGRLHLVVEALVRSGDHVRSRAAAITVVDADAVGVIGPAGGTVAVTKLTSPVFGASLTVPPGALDVDTVLVLQSPAAGLPSLPAGLTAASPVVETLPEGTRFRVPAVLRLPLLPQAPDAPMVPQSFDQQVQEWSVLDLHGSGPGYVDAETSHFSLNVITTLAAATAGGSMRLPGSAELAAFASQNAFGDANGLGERHFRCTALEPHGVTTVILNAGSIRQDGSLGAETPAADLAAAVRGHLAGSGSARVFLWLNHNEWDDDSANVVRLLFFGRRQLASEAAALRTKIVQGVGFDPGNRLGIAFDFEPENRVPHLTLNALFQDLLVQTRSALGVSAPIGIFPLKVKQTARSDDPSYWTPGELASVVNATTGVYVLYGAYDYSGAPTSNRAYSSFVATDLAKLEAQGLSSRTTVFLNSAPRNPFESPDAGVLAIRGSSATARLRGVGIFQFWGNSRAASLDASIPWPTVRQAFTSPPLVSYSDCRLSAIAPSGSSSSMGIGPAGPRTIGWQFTPTTAVEISHLGFFDAGQDGFAEPHTVGLFLASTRQLLASLTLPAGSSAPLLSTLGVTGPLAGLSRGLPISPYRLTAGQTYVVASTVDGDTWYINGSVAADSRIGYGLDVSTIGSGLSFPVQPWAPYTVGQYATVVGFR